MASPRSRRLSTLGTALVLCIVAAGATAAIVVDGTGYVRGGNFEEGIVAPFGPPSPPEPSIAVSTPTALTYAGLVEVVVSGDGVAGQDPAVCFLRNDAFYLFSDCAGNPTSPSHFDLYFQLAADTAQLQGGGFVTGATPYPQLAKNLIVFDVDGDTQITPVPAPVPVPVPYRADNTYRFVIDLARSYSWTGVPSVIHFGVADGGYADNVGSYNLDVYQLVEATPGEASLLQAVPFGSGTRVAVAVAGGDPDTTVDVELVSAGTCTAGTLAGSSTWGDLTGPRTLSVPLDGNGDGFVITDVEPIDPNTYAAARVSQSISGLSDCIVAGPDNDTWTRAADIALTRAVGEPAVGNSSGFIEAVGTSRWFKFQIQPGARATIELSDLPADYDLTVFKDIEQAFAVLANDSDVDALNQLGAEFAPSAFTPSAFTPSAFTPSAFTPSAFTPSAFTPSAFTPSAFTPSAFTPSAFTPSAFTPSAFTPSAFTPSAFTPSAFTQTAFNPSAFTPSAFTDRNFYSAQTRSLIAVSAQTGVATERVTVDTWNNTGEFYVRVSGKNGAAAIEQPFQLAVELDGELCNGVAPLADPMLITAANGGYETIILYDSEQLWQDGYENQQIAPLEERLALLAARDEVKGVVVDLKSNGDVQYLHAQADAVSSCPYAANLTAEAIKRVIDAYRVAGNPLKHVVLVGSDGQIPFFRYPDQGLLGPEQDYEPPMANDTQAQASLRLNYVLGQDEYGARKSLSLNDGRFPVPDLSVGRLVETIPEMLTVLDAYLATTDGVVSPTSTLVTGYDFLTDAADAIQAELLAGTNGDGRTAARNDTLITNADVAPSDACVDTHDRQCSWTASQLRRELLDQGEDLIFLAGHFSANNTLAADYLTTAAVTDLADSDVDLVNSVIFAAGCHSGYNIVDGDVVPNVTLPLDWTQAFAQKGATLVAGTGYQYGDTDFIEYSERLYLQFAKELRTGSEPVSVGEALVRAKQHYLKTTPDIRGLHRKSVLISTVFGLPMLRVDLNRVPDVTDGSVVAPTPIFGDNPGAALDLEEATVSLTFGPGEISEQTVVLNSVEGCADPADLSTCPTVTATYLRGPDGVVTNPYEPALPLQSVDVSVANRSLRGVGFRGGDWSESTVTPLTGAPAYEIRGVHTPFASLLNYPMRLATPNYYGVISQNQETILHVTPAQHRVPFIGSTDATLRRFSSLDFQLYYSANTATYSGNVPALAGPPTISQVQARVVGSDVQFTVVAVGAPAAGMQEVWVTYTDGSQASGTWESLPLTQDGADSRVWRGTLSGGHSGFGRLDFMVQAVNGVGLVSRDDNYGAYYQVEGGVVAPPQKRATALALSGPSGNPLPATVQLGAILDVEALLTDAGMPVDGAPIEFTVGGTTRVATTVNGYASAELPLNVTPPGEAVVVASFRGDQALLASSDQQPLEIEKAQPVLTLIQGAQSVGVDSIASGVEVLLKDGSGAGAAPMPNKWVYFTLYGGPDGLITKPAQTNNVGIAALGDLQLPPQSYPMAVRYLGEVPVPGQIDPLVLDSPIYEPAIVSDALNLIGGENCPTADVTSKLDLTGFCYLVHKVKGKVQITDGTLIVGGASEIVDEVTEDGVVLEGSTTGGIVDNKIDQYGAGGVIIHAAAQVKGKIVENGPGGIRVLGYTSNKLTEYGPGDVQVDAGGIVDGKIDEFDAGSITVLGSVGGGLMESGDGGIAIADSGSASGETVEAGAGSLVVAGSLVGDATEQDAGDLIVTATGTIDGDATESGDGGLFNDGTVTGSAVQD